MYKYILIIFCLLSSNKSEIFAPMSARTFELNVEDICSYQISNSEFIYVEPCEKDYKCEELTSYAGSPSGTIVGVCTKNLQEESPYGSSCEEDSDCESGYNLKCDSNICVLNQDSDAVEFSDSYTGPHYYCPNKNLMAIFDTSSDTDFKCKKIEDNENMKNYCELVSSGSRAYPGYMKVCGEIELDESNAHTKTKMDTIGTVSDGKFVENELACKSGFALKFYSDGKTTGGTNPNLKCVKYEGIEYKKGSSPLSCKIKYTLDKTYYYDADKVDSSLIGGDKELFCKNFKFIDAKLDLFKQYANKLNELGSQCDNIKYYDEPFTCKNDELRKLYYFYNNLEEYLLYKNEDEITEFLLQQQYPSYGVKYSKTDASNYLSNNLICLLILLLL